MEVATETTIALNVAANIARKNGESVVTLAHLLYALLFDVHVSIVLRRLGEDPDVLQSRLAAMLEARRVFPSSSEDAELSLSSSFSDTMQKAVTHARERCANRNDRGGGVPPYRASQPTEQLTTLDVLVAAAAALGNTAASLLIGVNRFSLLDEALRFAQSGAPPAPNKWGSSVVLHNDDVTTMEYVLFVLTIFSTRVRPKQSISC